MAFSTDLSVNHQVIAANSHTYAVPTEALYLDRTLICHDFIYLLDGEWFQPDQRHKAHLQRRTRFRICRGQVDYQRHRLRCRCAHLGHRV